MKQKKSEKKLSLKKATVSNLDTKDMSQLNGGGTFTVATCYGSQAFTCGFTCDECLTNWTCESNVLAYCTWDALVCNANSIGGCTDVLR